jgi:hypothetical protein
VLVFTSLEGGRMLCATRPTFIWRFLSVTVSVKVMPGRVLGVFRCVQVVRVSQMCVVGSRFVIAFKVVPGGFVVVACSVLMMLRCLGVMMGSLVGHKRLLSLCIGFGYSTHLE